MRPWIAALLLCGILAGCYRAHGREVSAGLDAGVDAAVRRDAGPPRADAGACDESKLRTSGLAEAFALGARCELLVVCLDVPSVELVSSRFPEANCTRSLDFACGGSGTLSCITSVGVLDAAEVRSGCELTLEDDVAAVVCAGDL